MKRTFNITWLILMVLTVISAVFANLDIAYVSIIILGLFFLKFIGVAFLALLLTVVWMV